MSKKHPSLVLFVLEASASEYHEVSIMDPSLSPVETWDSVSSFQMNVLSSRLIGVAIEIEENARMRRVAMVVVKSCFVMIFLLILLWNIRNGYSRCRSIDASRGLVYYFSKKCLFRREVSFSRRYFFGFSLVFRVSGEFLKIQEFEFCRLWVIVCGNGFFVIL